MGSSDKITRADLIKLTIQGILNHNEIMEYPFKPEKERAKDLEERGQRIAFIAKHVAEGMARYLNIREE